MADQDMVDVLQSDHRSVLRLLSDAQGSGTQGHFLELVEELTAELIRHATAEEQYLHPLLRDELSGGDALADTEHAADRRLEQLLRRLEDTEAELAEAQPVLVEIGEALSEHIARQDGQFATLRETVAHDRLVDLGDDVLGAEQLAPTRPRPVAPTNPVAAKITALAQGFVDHVREAYRHHPDPDSDPTIG